MDNEVFYGIALRLMKGIGDANAKTLISGAGGAENVFRLSANRLRKINGVGPKIADAFKDTYEALVRAEKEMRFIDKHKIIAVFYYDPRYPKRLLNCPDAPLILFCKGNFDFNRKRFISIVGTRHATDYGRALTEQLIAELAPFNMSLVSGLAFGIDICAHRAAVKHGIQNIAVLAHGLDRVYPHTHKPITAELQENGALVSDFLSGTNPDRQNFPSRNRIVAGMTDATIVIESAETGGALITAEIADSYNRDVFAFPGRVTDPFSQGCHKLVRENKANLVTSSLDIIRFLNWDVETKKKTAKNIQPQLFTELNKDETVIVEFIRARDRVHIDVIFNEINLASSVISTLLLQLEMKGVIIALPGKMFKIF